MGVTDSAKLGELAMRAKLLRERAQHARELAAKIGDRLASEGLESRASELEREAEAVDAEIAFLKQSMQQAQEPPQEVGALKPPGGNPES